MMGEGGRPIMAELDDHGHLFHPHEFNAGCLSNGCVPRPERRPGYYSPEGDEREQAVPCRRCDRPTWAFDSLCDPCAGALVPALSSG